jgi:hypothetical protein
VVQSEPTLDHVISRASLKESAEDCVLNNPEKTSCKYISAWQNFGVLSLNNYFIYLQFAFLILEHIYLELVARIVILVGVKLY